ncbi:MAG: hypothetical protein ACOY4R_04425 [Pseudomonadota bacterium]
MLSCIIIGGGPGGLGPLIWAAQHGRLEGWLDQGIAVVERRTRLGGTLGRFGIHSDSLGRSYLECLEAPDLPKRLRSLRTDPVTLEMERYRDTFPPLTLVDYYMHRIGLALSAMLGESDRSRLHLCTEATAIHLQDGGSIAVDIVGPDGAPGTLVARSAIMALGGRQSWTQLEVRPGLTLGHCRLRQVMPSDRLLSSAGLREADRLLTQAQGRRVLILGGAHSAYSAAGALLQLPAAATLSNGQIAIVQRREPRIFYPDRAAAAADLYDVADGDICPRTHRVNRMGGLRGHGREIWRRIARRPETLPEPRVAVLRLQDHSPEELRRMIEEAALVVPCFGYHSSTLPVFDASGERLALQADTGGIAVEDHCRLLASDGTSLHNLFGIGLGTGYRLPASMGGEPSFNGQANSLWLYHNDIGEIIYRAIQELRDGAGPADGEAGRSLSEDPKMGRYPLLSVRFVDRKVA